MVTDDKSQDLPKIDKERSIIFEEVMEGVPQEIRDVIIESLLFYEQDLSHIKDKEELSILEEEKISKLRFAFTKLNNWLLENKVGEFNEAQELFINTGALADIIYFENDDQPLQLLDPSLYSALREEINNVRGLPKWANKIYYVKDKYDAIAIGEIEPLGLDKKALMKFRGAKQTKSVEQIKALTEKQKKSLAESTEQIVNLEKAFESYYNFIRKIPEVQIHLKNLKRYNELSGKINTNNQEKEELKSLVSSNASGLGKLISKYSEDVIQSLNNIKDISSKVDEKIRLVREFTLGLIKDEISKSDREAAVFDEETIRLLKSDVTYINSFAVNASRNSPLRITESHSKILLDAHTERLKDPLKEGYCTIRNVTEALKKIMEIHTNLFPVDEEGNPIIPPFIIEPIRNYVEWFDDRFVMSFVSGEIPRKGPRYSFTPVDFQVLRACGTYLCKDRIFDYRGNRLEGTFMADYAGKLESKTAVKWQGDEKKFTLVATSQEVDSANREEAIKDYIEFLFNMANDFPPQPNLSKRKIAVMLRYIIFESIEKTILLTLKLLADKEPEEAKYVILHYANNDREKAKELIKKAIESNPTYVVENTDIYIEKIFGKG